MFLETIAHNPNNTRPLTEFFADAAACAFNPKGATCAIQRAEYSMKPAAAAHHGATRNIYATRSMLCAAAGMQRTAHRMYVRTVRRRPRRHTCSVYSAA
jgi:hypothetical protein